VQGRTLDKVTLELQGTRTMIINSETKASPCDPYNLYIQLSRCTSLDGITLVSRARTKDIVDNKVPSDMIAAEERLERLNQSTIRAEEDAWDW
jgi:hypothetical protein